MLAQGKKMSVKLLRKEDGRGELLVHFQRGVPPQEQMILATYIHDQCGVKLATVHVAAALQIGCEFGYHWVHR